MTSVMAAKQVAQFDATSASCALPLGNVALAARMAVGLPSLSRRCELGFVQTWNGLCDTTRPTFRLCLYPSRAISPRSSLRLLRLLTLVKCWASGKALNSSKVAAAPPSMGGIDQVHIQIRHPEGVRHMIHNQAITFLAGVAPLRAFAFGDVLRDAMTLPASESMERTDPSPNLALFGDDAVTSSTAWFSRMTRVLEPFDGISGAVWPNTCD
jgi:hypothetical protein